MIGQGSACTTILSAAEMQLHCALKNAQPGGEMTGFMRLGEQDIFSPITGDPRHSLSADDRRDMASKSTKKNCSVWRAVLNGGSREPTLRHSFPANLHFYLTI